MVPTSTMADKGGMPSDILLQCHKPNDVKTYDFLFVRDHTKDLTAIGCALLIKSVNVSLLGQK
jgi:hypothetical protein